MADPRAVCVSVLADVGISNKRTAIFSLDNISIHYPRWESDDFLARRITTFGTYGIRTNFLRDSAQKCFQEIHNYILLWELVFLDTSTFGVWQKNVLLETKSTFALVFIFTTVETEDTLRHLLRCTDCVGLPSDDEENLHHHPR